MDSGGFGGERGAGGGGGWGRATRSRLRPILMTTLGTVLGLLPMALGMGVGAEANVPLARAVIGGLTVSTALTLLLIPCLYVAVEKRLEHRRAARPADDL